VIFEEPSAVLPPRRIGTTQQVCRLLGGKVSFRGKLISLGGYVEYLYFTKEIINDFRSGCRWDRKRPRRSV